MNKQNNMIECTEMEVYSALTELVANKIKWKIWHNAQPADNYGELVPVIITELYHKESE